MFDIGWSELLVIVVVAVVVVGPKDLPRMMRTVGQWAGRARSMADQFRRSFDDMARQTELDELRREVQKLKESPMTIQDYEDFGIKESDFPKIEDVGVETPKANPPASSGEAPASPAAVAAETKPAVDTSASLAATAMPQQA
jgi:sec-independent protein translocase protein TatB